MPRALLESLTFAALGAVVSVVCLLVTFTRSRDLVLDMDRDLPRTVAQGFYPAERAGEQTFAWTTGRASVKLTDIDRRTAWTCQLRFRGARPDEATLPAVTVDVDGLTAATRGATNDFHELQIDIPPRQDRSGVTLTIVPSNTFQPGPGDKRELGIQVDRIACAAADAFVWPPARVLRHAAGTGAIFGATAALGGAPLALAAIVVLVASAGQGVLLSSGLAPYGAYSGRAFSLAAWIGACALGLLWALRAFRKGPLSATAVAALLISAVALYLKILGLLHPGKLIIDAVFHAHRFEWVLSGRYLFTQGMPGGVSFPYAIGLYVFASPWAALTNDHVSLLRIVVTTVEVIAGGLLYVLAVRAWRDGIAGVIAVALYHCVPITFEILGNANMTNVFGQAVALCAVIVCAAYANGIRAAIFWPLAFAVVTLAFLSHISTFTQLALTLVLMGGLFWWRGEGGLRPAGRTIVIIAVAAAVCAVVLYYGHFLDVYRTAWRARTQAAVTQVTPPPGSAAGASAVQPRASAPLHRRLGNGLRLSAASVGWPILLLAAIGLWRVISSGTRDRLSLAVLALLATYLAFLGASTFSRVDAPFERYAAEFVGRVVLATFPAAVTLAAVGAAWGWRAGLLPRALTSAGLLWAVSIGLTRWMAWFR